jgi:hypothetical protein
VSVEDDVIGGRCEALREGAPAMPTIRVALAMHISNEVRESETVSPETESAVTPKRQPRSSFPPVGQCR